MKLFSSRAVGTAMIASLALAAQAGAHAHVSPSIVEADRSETYTVVVPTEGASPTKSVEVTVPDGFQIGSFEAIPGVKREVVATGEGDEAVISKVTWTGLNVPEGEAAYLRFQGRAEKAGDYAFKTVQTMANGEVEEWTGPESSDTPAPVVNVRDSLGGGSGESGDDDGTDTLTIVALILAGIALLLGIGAFVRGGGRSLT